MAVILRPGVRVFFSEERVVQVGTVRARIDRTAVPGWAGGAMADTDPEKFEYVVVVDDHRYGCALRAYAPWVVEQAVAQGVYVEERVVLERFVEMVGG